VGALAADRASPDSACASACAAYRALLGGECFDALTTQIFNIYALINATAAARLALPAVVCIFWSAQLAVGAGGCAANANTDPNVLGASMLRARDYAAVIRYKFGACVLGANTRSVADVEAAAEATAAALPAAPAALRSSAARRGAAGAVAAALAAAALA
jgi:hypothetical protein